MNLRRVSAAVAAAVVLGGLAISPSTAAASLTGPASADGVAAPCFTGAGSVNSGGDLRYSNITATTPPSATQASGPHMYTPGAARISSTWTDTVLNPVGRVTSGYVVLGSALYQSAYGAGTDGKPINQTTRIGGGWGNFTMVEESFYLGAGAPETGRGFLYGLRGDGVLLRWTTGWRVAGAYPGFAAVKAMTLISETATYDTFLATTRSGGLYTIRIPVSSALKPVVKQVRSSTWQGFEHLTAEKCGAQGTLLTGIDKDSGAAYLYAVSHANGSATVIKPLGKVPGTFKDPVYHLVTAEGNPPLFGE